MLISEKKNLSTKEMIVDVLSTNVDITAKVIYNKIRHSKKLTYHAIFKLLNQMVEEGIIIKENRTYYLNAKWITNAKEYYQKLEHTYLNRKEAMLINKDTEHFILPSIHEGFIILMRAVERGVFGDSKILVGHFSHLLYLQLSKDEADLLKRIGKERKCYYLVNHKSNLDKLIQYYNKHTFDYKTKIGVPCANPFYLYAIGDKIIQISISNELREAMDKIYNHAFVGALIPKPRIKQITTFVNEVAHKKTTIHVHVIKNKEAAQDIIKKTLKYF